MFTKTCQETILAKTSLLISPSRDDGGVTGSGLLLLFCHLYDAFPGVSLSVFLSFAPFAPSNH